MTDLATADVRTLEAILRNPMIGEPAKERVRRRLEDLRGQERPNRSIDDKPDPLPVEHLSAGVQVLELILFGPPRTKKTSNSIAWRTGDDGKRRPKVIPSAAWLAWRDSLRATRQLPATETPLPDRAYQCRALFFRDRDAGDLVGYQQGLADVLEEFGVISDDRWIQSWDGSRLLVDRACPRVELEVLAL